MKYQACGLNFLFYFFKKSKDTSPEKHKNYTHHTLTRLKSTNNNYQFEDLSHFVIQENIPSKEKYLSKSILKTKSNSSKDLASVDNQDNEKKEFLKNRQFRQSKSVQINNDDSIYGNIFKISNIRI